MELKNILKISKLSKGTTLLSINKEKNALSGIYKNTPIMKAKVKQ